jgi:hypothetical protein
MPTSREEDLEWPKARSDRDLAGDTEDWLLGVVGVVGEGKGDVIQSELGIRRGEER